MHQQLVNQYTDIMASLANLPGEIAAVQTDLNAAKMQLATSDRYAGRHQRRRRGTSKARTPRNARRACQ